MRCLPNAVQLPLEQRLHAAVADFALARDENRSLKPLGRGLTARRWVRCTGMGFGRNRVGPSNSKNDLASGAADPRALRTHAGLIDTISRRAFRTGSDHLVWPLSQSRFCLGVARRASLLTVLEAHSPSGSFSAKRAGPLSLISDDGVSEGPSRDQISWASRADHPRDNSGSPRATAQSHGAGPNLTRLHT